MESGYVRKGLNTRIAEELNRLQSAGSLLWAIDHDAHTGALRYHVEQAGEVYFFSPGRCAAWLGLEADGADQ